MILALLACQGTVEGDFDALTYNIAGLPQGISSSDPERFIPQMGDKMNAYDLVVVQEDFSYHELYAPDVTLPHRSEPKPDPPLGVTDAFLGDGLNRFSVFPFEPVERTQWPACFGLVDNASDCLAEKGFSTAHTTLDDEVELLVVNLHAEAGGGPHDVGARTQGFALLATVIAEAPGAVLVGGDTNLKPDEREGDRAIYDDFLAVSGLVEVEQQDPERDHIDRFFYRSSPVLELEPVEWAVATEFVDDQGNDLSDHPAIRTGWHWTFTR